LRPLLGLDLKAGVGQPLDDDFSRAASGSIRDRRRKVVAVG
jgi:hypothetical protein